MASSGRTPILGDAVARANFTNEIGAFGTVRFLKNVMGLWILESCRREWERDGRGCDYSELIAGAAALEDFVGFVFPDDLRFLNPSSMVEMLRACLTQTGQPAPQTPVHLTRVVLDSLALRYASVIDTIEHLTGSPITHIHVVGGGARNEYLNQATANATGRRVLGGPRGGHRGRQRASCRRSRAGRCARWPTAGRWSRAAFGRSPMSLNTRASGSVRASGTSKWRRHPRADAQPA